MLRWSLIGLLLLPGLAVAQAGNGADIAKNIDAVLAGKIPLDQVRIKAHWAPRGGQGATVQIYGRGLGIWNRQVQFSVTKQQILDMLRHLKKAKFAAMPQRFGGLDFKGPGPRPGVPEVLVGEVTLVIGAKRKSVFQLGGGKQSAELAKLAATIINACVEPAKTGLREGRWAKDLSDGLRKIAQKKLDPLTLSLLVHRIQGQGTGPTGWLMRVEGTTVTVQVRGKRGYGRKIVYEMPRKQLEAMIDLLLKNHADQLPINLYANDYTDLRIEVLDKEKSMQARKFARMTPQTHGERQKQFDRIFAALDQLHREALAKGKKSEPSK